MKTVWLALFALFSIAAHAANPQVEMKTSLGAVTIELYPDKAPKTVENFLEYVKDGHYAGTIFHRVISGFMIQGGGFTTGFREKPTRAPIVNESNNGLKNDIGTIAMARTNLPNSATSQFFINVAENKFLNYFDPSPAKIGYCVFGRVIKGMDVVNRIAASRTGPGGPFPTDVPENAVVIENMTLISPK